MKKSNKFSPEVRERAVRLVQEHRGEYPSLWAAAKLANNEAIKEAILAGLGLAIMSRFTLGLEPEPSRLICLDVDGFPLENHWYFAYPVGKQLSATARAFMDFSRIESKVLMMQGITQYRQ